MAQNPSQALAAGASASDQQQTQLAKLRADDTRQWCEAFEKHELVDIIVNLSDGNPSFQSFLGHALVTDIKWCKIRVSFPAEVASLAQKPSKEELFDVFGGFGAMNKIELILNPSANDNSGNPYALITFRRYTDAQSAVSVGYHDMRLGNDTSIRVSCCYAFENEETGNENDEDQDMQQNQNQNQSQAQQQNQQNQNQMTQMQQQQGQMGRIGGGGGGGFAQTLANLSQDGGPLAQRRIFVSSLAYATSNDTLRGTFSQYGELDDCTIIFDKFTGRSKGYGFVIFKNVAGAQNALKQPEKFIDGRKTRCWLAAEGRNQGQQNRY